MMMMKAFAVGLLVLLPQLGFVWTEARGSTPAVPVEWESDEPER